MCFCSRKSSVLLDNSRIPFDMLFVNSFKVPLTFLLFIRTWRLCVLEDFKQSCIVRSSCSSSSILPSSQSDSHLDSASSCSFDFENLLGFWSNKAGITWTVFCATDSYCVLFIHKLKRCVASLIYISSQKQQLELIFHWAIFS